jgi:hypothetical protein
VIAEKSASEGLLCESKALFGVCDPVRLKTMADRLKRLACSECKLCKPATVLYLIVVTTCELLIFLFI